ncbi:MAG: ATP-grasp domain-containing protein [Spirochaetia bacterium]
MKHTCASVEALVKDKILLILGAGVMQIPAIKAARRMGLKVCCADGNSDAPGRGLADVFGHIDLKDLHGLTDFAAANKAEGVFTAGTDFSTSVAWIAEKLGLPGIPYKTALHAKDKLLMRKRLAEAGIPVPRFYSSSDDSAVKEEFWSAGLLFPVVVKPADSMGARGVRTASAITELQHAVQEARSFSFSKRVIVEEYITGPEFSIDALIYENNVYECGFADRHIYFPPHFIELGHTIPTNLSADKRKEVFSVFAQAVTALGIHTGAAKGDVFLTENGPMIGEIAARLSGGFMSGWSFPIASGVDLTSAAIRIALGFPPGDIQQKKQHFCAERAWISVPGTVQEVYNIPEPEPDSSVKEVFTRISKGDKLVFPRNNVEKCGNLLVERESYEAASTEAERLVGEIVLRLSPGCLDTARFLLSDKHETGPSAFIPGPQFLASIKKLDNLYENENKKGITIWPLDDFSDIEHQWFGPSFIKGLDIVKKYCGAEFSKNGRYVIAGVFWKAYVTGGIQGGLWAVDTVQWLLENQKHPREYFQQW